jgi:hypothetical protein
MIGIALIRRGFDADYLPALAISKHLERPATHFAIGGELLVGEAGVNNQLTGLAAIGAQNVCEFFHGAI